MEKRDGRKMSHESLEEIRIMAVRAVEAGESPETVMKILGFSRSRIYKWLAAYREGGIEALRAKQLSGRPPKLDTAVMKKVYEIVTTRDPHDWKFAFWTKVAIQQMVSDEFGVKLSGSSVLRLMNKLGLSAQGAPASGCSSKEAQKTRILDCSPNRDASVMEKVYEIVTTKNPLDLNLEFALWTRGVIRKMIRHKFGVKLSKASVARLMNKLGLSAPEPLVQAYRRDFEATQKWYYEEYPLIQKEARRVKAVIYFADESRIRVDEPSARMNMISAVSSRKDFRFMCMKECITAKVFLEFINRLMRNADRPVFLIVDGNPVHHSTEVKEFLRDTKYWLRLYYLQS